MADTEIKNDLLTAAELGEMEMMRQEFVTELALLHQENPNLTEKQLQKLYQDDPERYQLHPMSLGLEVWMEAACAGLDPSRLFIL